MEIKTKAHNQGGSKWPLKQNNTIARLQVTNTEYYLMITTTRHGNIIWLGP